MRALIFLLLLAGCTRAEDADTRVITRTVVSTQAELQAACRDALFVETSGGCAKGSATQPGGGKSGDRCEIVVLALKHGSYDDHAGLEVVGHEVWHCFNGPLHI